MTYQLPDGTTKKLTETQCFYLYHHLKVLGEERGSMQVGHRLELAQWQIVSIYHELCKKAHQMAV